MMRENQKELAEIRKTIIDMEEKNLSEPAKQ